MRILIIDHSTVTRQLICRVLLGLGLQREDCLQAGSGQEALEIVHEGELDCVVTTWDMPDMDGLTFTKVVRMNARFRDLPIIMIARKRSFEDVALAVMEAGVTDYLAMPFNPELLRRKVTAAVEGLGRRLTRARPLPASSVLRI